MIFFFFLMILRPPRSTRTDTLFPYTTLFRSDLNHHANCLPVPSAPLNLLSDPLRFGIAQVALVCSNPDGAHDSSDAQPSACGTPPLLHLVSPAETAAFLVRAFGSSEERRVGKECVSTCRSRWSPYH